MATTTTKVSGNSITKEATGESATGATGATETTTSVANASGATTTSTGGGAGAPIGTTEQNADQLAEGATAAALAEGGANIVPPTEGEPSAQEASANSKLDEETAKNSERFKDHAVEGGQETVASGIHAGRKIDASGNIDYSSPSTREQRAAERLSKPEEKAEEKAEKAEKPKEKAESATAKKEKEEKPDK